MDINVSEKILSDKYMERTKSGSKEVDGKTPINFTEIETDTLLCSPSLFQADKENYMES